MGYASLARVLARQPFYIRIPVYAGLVVMAALDSLYRMWISR